jgi:uncharacterized Tic20 family protein
MSLSHCPKCGNPLNPTDASGHQLCRSCGWSSDPDRPQISKSDDSSFAGAFGGENYTVISSALCHASMLIVPLIIPIAFLYGSSHEMIRANARSAINFQINSLILLFGILSLSVTAGVIAGFSAAILLITFLGGFWAIFIFILTWIAVIQTFRYPNTPADYVLIYRFLK